MKNPGSSLPTVPLVAPLFSDADPRAILTTLVGSPCVTLRGFHESKMKAGIFLHPSIHFIDVRSVNKIDKIIDINKRKWETFVFVGRSLIIFSIAFSMGILGSQFTTQFLENKPVDKHQSAPAWSIVDVVSTGVFISVNNSKPIFIAVGSTLPNSDLVISVAPKQRSIFLASGTVTLRPPTSPHLPFLKDPK